MKSVKKICCIIASAVVIPAVLLSCKKAEAVRTELIFGTVCSVNAYNDGTKKLYDELFERLHVIDSLFSTTNPQSEIEKINAASGIQPLEVSPEVVSVLKIALSFARLTDGLFDPTIGPVVKLWGINTDHAHVPSADELTAALKLVNWQNVIIKDNSVFLPQKGMRLDLGGIVKGYAADVLVGILKNNKVKGAVINLGGNIYVYGTKKDKSLWRVGIKNPDDPEGTPEMVLSLKESTVVTSGVYERFFIQDGIRYHHIINPKTGYPVNNSITSVSVICKSSTTADALSTSLFILGPEKGNALVEEIEKRNAAFTASADAASGSEKEVSDGMGMWLFNGIPGENASPVQVTDDGIPYLLPLESFPSVLETVFISEDGKITASKDLQSLIEH